MKERQRQIRADKKRVREIYGDRCANIEQCENDDKPQIHHLIYKADGKPIDRTEQKSNYVPLCDTCHKLLHDIAE